jgi:hypothetical protein
MSCPDLSSHGHVSNVSGGWFRSHVSGNSNSNRSAVSLLRITQVLHSCSLTLQQRVLCLSHRRFILLYRLDRDIAGNSSRRPEFAPGSFRLGFLVDKLAPGQFFPSSSPFSCQYNSAVFPILILGGRDYKLSLACRREQQHSAGSMAARSEA